MMEMDGRGNAKCQKSKSGDIDDIIEFVLHDNKTKLCHLLQLKLEAKNVNRKGERCSSRFLFFLVRESVTSL